MFGRKKSVKKKGPEVVAPPVEEIKTEYQIPSPTEKETFVPKAMREPSFVPPPRGEPMMSEEIEISPTGIEEISQRKGMPPYSRGWAGSIGGSRPYRPVPYKPTGKIWKPERVSHPNPKIPVTSFNMWKPLEQRHVSNPKMPVTTFKFMR